ncbi:MAG: metallophosphoesterase [Hyphomicrobiaceae bacterium]|nr:metallophosphoesterase [Hyphomicrobiaceae bacterium]
MGALRLSRRKFLASLGVSSASLLGPHDWAVAEEMPPRGWRLAVTSYAVAPTGWTNGPRLKIGVIADIHAGGPVMPARRIRAVAEHTNALRPDIVVLLGDFAASHKLKTEEVAPQEWAEALSVLKAPLGVHAVLGNHDWWDDLDAQRTGKGPVLSRTVLEDVGIPVYENDAVRLEKDGKPFWLAGLGSQMAFIRSKRKKAFRKFEGVDDLEGTLAQITDDAPVLLLAHEPYIFPRVPRRVALTLSGHTHGGQVRFGFSPRVQSRFGKRYSYGHFCEDERDLIVSGGLGCSVLPVRVGVPPEIVVVDVAYAPAAEAVVASRTPHARSAADAAA